jgi:histidinol dehydrogenase
LIRTFAVTDVKKDVARLRGSRAAITDELIEKVASIVKDVEDLGDKAIIDYTQRFDGALLNSLKVSGEEFKHAFSLVTKKQLQAINAVKAHLIECEKPIMENLDNISVLSDGIKIRRSFQPIPSVGCYIPGGKARYVSTVLMCTVPAKVAGVKRIVAISPPQRDGTIDPLTLVAARICGVKEFYKVGGVQGIAALAHGTSTIERVSKIVGPGGILVTAAKFLVSREVSIDMVAGPTELLIYADSNSDSRLIALDLISQAEHSSDTFCGLVTESYELASRVSSEVINILKDDSISRTEIVRESLKSNGFIAICKRQTTALDFVNELAPEHLQLVCKNARRLSEKIKSAGLILIGKYSPSSASDYCFGTNHILPTSGFGKTRGSLSALDFLKLTSTVEANKKGLLNVQSHIHEITSAEGLINHFKAVQGRSITK